jgi:hypothetical protein
MTVSLKNGYFRVAVLFGFFIFISVTQLSAQEPLFHMKAGVGIDLLGNHKVTVGSTSGNAAVDTGFSVDLEAGMKYSFLFIAIGYEAQFNRKQTQYAGKFNFMPFYLYIEANADFEFLSPYILGKIGYAFLFNGDIQYTGTYGVLTGGLYWAGGIGFDLIRFKNIFNNPISLFVEVSYSFNYGSLYDWYFSYKADVEYSKLNIRVGTRSSF